MNSPASFPPQRLSLSGFAAGAFLSLAGVIAPASAQVTITPEENAVHVLIDGKPFTDFVLRNGNAMKPYLYPLRSATGQLVTRHFPMERFDGVSEPTDHPHQRGLWFAHERVNGFDFWNNEADYKTPIRGRIVVTKVSDVQSGPAAGSFKIEADWNDPEGKKLLSESRTMTFRKTPTLRLIDVDVTLAATAGEVTFGDSKDGAFGIRLAAALQEPNSGPKGSGNTVTGTGQILNAEGEKSKAAWGKPSNWVDYSGEVDGQKVGVTIFDHPGNTRRARWHVRDYGLFAANAFGLKVFTGDKTQDGSLVLKAGESLRLRYRVVIHPGDAKAAEPERLWDAYVKEAK